MDSENDNELNEPAFPFGTIRKATFESLEEENRLYSLKLSPLERMIYMHELTLNAYGAQTASIKEIELVIRKK